MNFFGVFCFLLCFVRSGSSSGWDTGPIGRSASLPIRGLLPLGSVLSGKVTLWSMLDGPYAPFSGLACLDRMGQVSKLSAALFLLLFLPVARSVLFSDLDSNTILQGGMCLLMAMGLLTGTGLLTTMGLLTGTGLVSGTGFETVTSLVTGICLVSGTGLVIGMGLVTGTGLETCMGLLTVTGLVTGIGLLTVTGLLMPMGLLTPTGLPTVTGLLTPMGLLTPTGRLMVTGRLTGPGLGAGRGWSM